MLYWCMSFVTLVLVDYSSDSNNLCACFKTLYGPGLVCLFITHIINVFCRDGILIIDDVDSI